jgi:hypothetical protein
MSPLGQNVQTISTQGKKKRTKQVIVLRLKNSTEFTLNQMYEFQLTVLLLWLRATSHWTNGHLTFICKTCELVCSREFWPLVCLA